MATLSVKYVGPGFEADPGRQAWVERVLTPLAEEVFRDVGGAIDLHWYDPGLPGVAPGTIDALVRQHVTPELGPTPLLGELDGMPAGPGMWFQRPGVVLVVVSPGRTPGWTYLPWPGPGEVADPFRIKWAIRSLLLTVLQNTVRAIVDGFGRVPAAVGV